MRLKKRHTRIVLLAAAVCVLLALMCSTAFAVAPKCGKPGGNPGQGSCNKPPKVDPLDAKVVTEFTKNAYFLRGNPPTSGILYCDSSVAKGANFLAAMWVLPDKVWAADPKDGTWIAEGWHQHLYDEVLLFSSGGANPENITADRDLGGQVEVWIGGEQHVIKSLSYVFVPKGVPHKIVYRDMSKPILEIKNLQGPSYARIAVCGVPSDPSPADDFGHLIWSQVLDWGGGPPAGISANYIGVEDAAMNLPDGSPDPGHPLVAAGFPFTDHSIILPNPQNAQGMVFGWRLPHAHIAASGEYFMSIGTNGYTPSRLRSETRWVVNDKVFWLNTTGFVYVPPGTWHCPIDYVSVFKPTFFTTLGSGPYTDWPFVPRPVSDWPVWPGVPPVLDIPPGWPN